MAFTSPQPPIPRQLCRQILFTPEILRILVAQWNALRARFDVVTPWTAASSGRPYTTLRRRAGAAGAFTGRELLESARGSRKAGFVRRRWARGRRMHPYTGGLVGPREPTRAEVRHAMPCSTRESTRTRSRSEEQFGRTTLEDSMPLDGVGAGSIRGWIPLGIRRRRSASDCTPGAADCLGESVQPPNVPRRLNFGALRSGRGGSDGPSTHASSSEDSRTRTRATRHAASATKWTPRRSTRGVVVQHDSRHVAPNAHVVAGVASLMAAGDRCFAGCTGNHGEAARGRDVSRLRDPTGTAQRTISLRGPLRIRLRIVRRPFPNCIQLEPWPVPRVRALCGVVGR